MRKVRIAVETKGRGGLEDSVSEVFGKAKTLKNFTKTLTPEVEVNCLVCPPDEHPKDLWCRWEFKL